MRLRTAALLVPLAVAGCTSTAQMPSETATPRPPAGPTPTALADVDLVQRYQATITPGELQGLLYTYADDYMAGRETGQPGQRFAARFLAGQYAAMGITPKGTGTGGPLDRYLQPFELEQKTLQRLTLTVDRADGSRALTREATADDLSGVVAIPAYGQIESGAPARLVFVGDGSQLDGLALEGAYAVMTPGADQQATRGALAALNGVGVEGVFLAASPAAAALQAQAGRAFGPGRLALPAEDDTEPGDGGLPTILLMGQDTVAQLMAEAGIEAGADGTYPRGDTGLVLALDADYQTSMVETENVVAFVEGSDPVLKNEVVVVSAHLDHVGDDGEGEDTIYNGADDDGSGTVTVLEIAEAFQQARLDGHGPRRSILLLHVTGEEKGLLGSEYYADREPLVPVANTAANLNIDMIGRYDPERGFETTDYVYIIGGDLISQDIADWNAAVNDATGTDIFLSDRFNSPDDPNQFFRRSDHWNFGKYDVPFIFYFTGTHEDYHGVGDSPDKIDYDRMARIGRLIFGTAWEIANRDERPAVSGVGFN